MGNYADLLNAQHQQPSPPARAKPRRAGRSVRQTPATQARPEPTPVSHPQEGSPPIERTPERPNARTTERPHEPPNARTPVRRSVKRYSFELYDDQIERVKRLALEDQLRGGTLNMSVIVRQAIDRYLAELGKGEEPNG